MRKGDPHRPYSSPNRTSNPVRGGVRSWNSPFEYAPGGVKGHQRPFAPAAQNPTPNESLKGISRVSVAA